MAKRKEKPKTPNNGAIKPNRLLGQHFLVDKSVLQEIVKAAKLSPEDTVLEIGPGLGVLTQELVKYAKRVVAVEKDANLAALLKEKLKDNPAVEVINEDILDFLDQENYAAHFLRAAGFEHTDYKVVANIPYYLTAHLIRKLLEAKNPPTDIILMIQKEVAVRLCARPPRMSILSASVQFYAKPQIISLVSRRAFWPIPQVDSALIEIWPSRADLKVDPDAYFKIIKAGFSHPRKQLISNLMSGLGLTRAKISQTLQKLDIKPEQRAETLSVEDWCSLTRLLES